MELYQILPYINKNIVKLSSQKLKDKKQYSKSAFLYKYSFNSWGNLQFQIRSIYINTNKIVYNWGRSYIPKVFHPLNEKDKIKLRVYLNNLHFSDVDTCLQISNDGFLSLVLYRFSDLLIFDEEVEIFTNKYDKVEINMLRYNLQGCYPITFYFAFDSKNDLRQFFFLYLNHLKQQMEKE